jgi:hypothetical protein
MKLVTDYWSLLFFFIRCPPAMQIVLYMLKAWLGASRTHLSRHLLDKPLFGPVAAQGPGNLAGVTSDSEREERLKWPWSLRKKALSFIVLELCLQTPEDEVIDILFKSRKLKFITRYLVFLSGKRSTDFRTAWGSEHCWFFPPSTYYCRPKFGHISPFPGTLDS